ncbi:hypothetical protein [Cedecea neteri]|nr:hypothetical protein [Cedecea neteri]
MTYSFAGCVAVGAIRPNESQLERRFRQAIDSVRRYLEALCNSI